MKNKITTSIFRLLGIYMILQLACCMSAYAQNLGTEAQPYDDEGYQNLSWEPGSTGGRMISPSGDILDSNMDALSPLQVSPIQLSEDGLTLDVLQNPAKAKEPLAKALYIPTDPKKLAEMTSEELEKITINQKEVLNQASAHVTTFGLKSDQNTDDFEKRRLRALEFIKTAENDREDIQVLTGATLGMVAEMNKMLSLSTSRAILKASDNLSSASIIKGE